MNEIEKLEEEGTAAVAAVERAVHEVLDAVDRRLQAVFGSHPVIASTIAQAKKDVSAVVAPAPADEPPTEAKSDDENPNPEPSIDPIQPWHDETPSAAS